MSNMSQLGFYFNEAACSGCRACQVACKDRNDLPVGVAFRKVTSYQSGTYPNGRIYHHSSTCNHCVNPACVANCPTGAMQKAEDGTVVHDDALCIGCENCVRACPYTVPVLLEDKGIVGKCDSCKAQRDAGHNPVCVDACIMRALDFGEIDQLVEKYGPDLVYDMPYLPSSETTGPSTLIKPKECALSEEFEVALL